MYTSVLPSISIDGDRLAASTLSCICRSFVLSCHLDRFVALSFKLALDRRFWATFERQVGPGPAFWGTFECQVGPGPAVLGTFERQVAPGPAVLDETSVSGTRRESSVGLGAPVDRAPGSFRNRDFRKSRKLEKPAKFSRT